MELEVISGDHSGVAFRYRADGNNKEAQQWWPNQDKPYLK